MATNDPMRDSHNPPGTTSRDFERFTFGELEPDELFWQTNKPGNNIPWRKINKNQGFNIKAKTAHNFQARTIVWQKV